MEGFIKLNIDACSLGNSGRSGTWGIFCDHRGNHILSFLSGLGVTTNFVAEFEAFFMGIRITKEQSWLKLWVECDSHAMAICIKKCTIPWFFQQQWRSLKAYLDTITWSIAHCYREANNIANNLAKHTALAQ
ncbi:uncharacterized protein LOC122065141, partial [Macadamia integrifolia]|uniref:uncharacterized protein LOC122065141 n=1 Tax=Macadamia integrifolia TaxID=60698 RepID=UPI001C4FC6FF